VIELTLAEVCTAVGGELDGGADPSAVVTGPVVVDSRQARPGALFVALHGEQADGHDFTRGAHAAGAVAALAARRTGVPAVVVPDVEAGLGRLARAVLDRLPGLSVVGVTGSSGKTSTKDMLAQVLAPAGPVVAPEGSYNNEIGLPLTALRAEDSTRTLVLELGARGRGHVAYLCRVAHPQVGVVLNVGLAHVGEFGSQAAIARSKAELVESLPTTGLAVLNADDPLVAAMVEYTRGRVSMFGESPEADVRADDVRLDDRGRAHFSLATRAGIEPVQLRLHGAHHVSNALASAAVALELGLPLREVAAGLAAAVPRSRWRMEVHDRPDGVTVVNDAYNANPDSVRAALQTLAVMGAGRRTWAVLGEMRELGDQALAEHDAVGRLAVRLDVARLVVVGDGARAMHLGATLEGSWGGESVFVPDAAAALAAVRAGLRPGDVVLVKASRAAGLERVAEALVTGEDVA